MNTHTILCKLGARRASSRSHCSG